MKAHARQIRISPRKVRLVANLLRGLDVVIAEQELRYVNKSARKPIGVVLKSAIANAENNFDLEKDNLFIKEIFVAEGPKLKRWRAASKGSAAPIVKRTSHISIALEEKVKGKKKAAKSKKKKDVKILKLKTKDDISRISKKEDRKEKKTKKREGEDKTGFFQGGRKEKKFGKGDKGKLRGFVNRFFRRKSEG
ncbi:MAG: hypothetical protein ACD_63C00108G0010 [uncultured bacterium]|nr:MAG: hypothetical protein ACD_63C00108G0010 [uncultured bacterium]